MKPSFRKVYHKDGSSEVVIQDGQPFTQIFIAADTAKPNSDHSVWLYHAPRFGDVYFALTNDVEHTHSSTLEKIACCPITILKRAQGPDFEPEAVILFHTEHGSFLWHLSSPSLFSAVVAALWFRRFQL
jgi:hypothetical protein